VPAERACKAEADPGHRYAIPVPDACAHTKPHTEGSRALSLRGFVPVVTVGTRPRQRIDTPARRPDTQSGARASHGDCAAQACATRAGIGKLIARVWPWDALASSWWARRAGGGGDERRARADARPELVAVAVERVERRVQVREDRGEHGRPLRGLKRRGRDRTALSRLGGGRLAV